MPTTAKYLAEYTLMRDGDRTVQMAELPQDHPSVPLVASLHAIWQNRHDGIRPVHDTVHSMMATQPIVSYAADTEFGIQGLASSTQRNPTDNIGIANTGAITLEARGGERARMVVDATLPEHGWGVHLLGTLRNNDTTEPVLALRTLHGNDRETPVVTWRDTGHVMFAQIYSRIHWHGTPRLLSVIGLRNEVRLYVDGVLLWARAAEACEQVSGFNLDLIGVGDIPNAFDVHWFEVVTFTDTDPAFRPNDFDIPAALITDALETANARALAPLLHAFPNCAPLLNDDALAGAISHLARDSEFYPEQAVHALLQFLPATLREGVVATLRQVVPAPVLSVRHMGISLWSNAAGKFDLLRLATSGRKSEKIQILENINFNVFPEDVIGVIGRNGAGKSTLLRAVTGAVPLSSGEIGVIGRPVLLRPGAGMTAELTGRNNIVRAGLYMGLTTRQIADIMDDVIEFSELGDHIDRPYSYYSDGMRSRLIFSLATCVSPEILMLDELLSAGDVAFQEKAMKRLDEFLERARVIILVQHGMDFVLKRCTKCLYIRRGKQVFFGDPAIATEMYHNEV